MLQKNAKLQSKPLTGRQRTMYLSDIKKKLLSFYEADTELYFKHTVQVETNTGKVNIWGIVLTNDKRIMGLAGSECEWFPIENSPVDDKVILVVWQKISEITLANKNETLNKKIW